MDLCPWHHRRLASCGVGLIIWLYVASPFALGSSRFFTQCYFIVWRLSTVSTFRNDGWVIRTLVVLLAKKITRKNIHTEITIFKSLTSISRFDYELLQNAPKDHCFWSCRIWLGRANQYISWLMQKSHSNSLSSTFLEWKCWIWPHECNPFVSIRGYPRTMM